MNDSERQALIRDLRALFGQLRRLGYLDGYQPSGEPEAEPGEPEAKPGEL